MYHFTHIHHMSSQIPHQPNTLSRSLPFSNFIELHQMSVTVTHDGDELGERIVMEDNEELPSKTMNSWIGDTSLVESPSPEPSPELVIGRTLSPVSSSFKGAEGVKEKDVERRMGEVKGAYNSSCLCTRDSDTWTYGKWTPVSINLEPPPPPVHASLGTSQIASFTFSTSIDFGTGGIILRAWWMLRNLSRKDRGYWSTYEGSGTCSVAVELMSFFFASPDAIASEIKEAMSTPISPGTASPPTLSGPTKPMNTKPSPLSFSQNAVVGLGNRGASAAAAASGVKSPTIPPAPTPPSISLSPAASMLSHRAWAQGWDHGPIEGQWKAVHRCELLLTCFPSSQYGLPKQDDSASFSPPRIVDSETLQVKNMDLEHVRPNIGCFEVSRRSEDSVGVEVDDDHVIDPAFPVNTLFSQPMNLI
ncbi:hypothetical protein BDQ17DRAFT_1495358 [Cyathus striatus]|nr:hypothetical protein BDQ17DRAFT_1495358 [Cyathus striatus]